MSVVSVTNKRYGMVTVVFTNSFSMEKVNVAKTMCQIFFSEISICSQREVLMAIANHNAFAMFVVFFPCPNIKTFDVILQNTQGGQYFHNKEQFFIVIVNSY